MRPGRRTRRKIVDADMMMIMINNDDDDVMMLFVLYDSRF